MNVCKWRYKKLVCIESWSVCNKTWLLAYFDKMYFSISCKSNLKLKNKYMNFLEVIT